MSDNTNKTTSRRDFLKGTGRIVTASAVMASIAPRMYAGQSNTIKVALIGCGGRGTGAADNALSVKRGPMQLVAMGDVFENRLKSSYENLNKMHARKMDVPRDRRFIGFDAYKKAMDCLSPGDVAIFATPPAFRWVHFKYAIKKGLNVFMEKPVTVDGPTSRRMFELGKQADAKNLKVGVGLMSRHQRDLEQLRKKIQDGALGDIILQRGYRMHGPIGFFHSLPKPPGISDLMYQIQRFHSFLWASGGNFSDFNIHIIDHQAWMKDAWPIKAHGTGGRHYKTSPDGVAYVDQNFDTYSVEYTYADGTKFFMEGRCMEGCHQIYSSAAHGTKGMAIVSKSGDCGRPSSIFSGQDPVRVDRVWVSEVDPAERNPYQNEWNDLVDAIRDDEPYNETASGVKTSLVTSMGRMAAHTGQEITYEEILNSDHEMAPGLDKLTANSRAPLVADAEGRYPVPQPGITKTREY
ncbi:MAG: Gfo/Idh/MocA family oxidoreductase [Planctomycetes bacterium]|nr:Gfo/Idh/MocA family oxidoreductase [Planctomycetota bacterium]